MVMLRPRDFQIDGYAAPADLTYEFAVSATEIRLDSLLESDSDHTQEESYQLTSQNVPAAGVLIFRAAKYCNWLSRQDNLSPDEWCYPPETEITTKNCNPVAGYESKMGYRLPLSIEWEYACRAGSKTSRFFGEDVRLMQFYAWHRKNTETLIHPVAELLPNAFGLFDMYGNVSEVCLADRTGQTHVMRGESCFSGADKMDSATAVPANQQSLTRWQGFRVVRRVND
jgi:formylglycine-generating enzyme required for sulfatase activity